MTAALELRKAGYKVQVLEFNSRPGGRNWTLRGGDSFTELGGFKQTCEFEQGLYINPGPWRIPYHHRALLDYCRRLGVALEPFIQLNHNALLHSSRAFGGEPQRIRDDQGGFPGTGFRAARESDPAGQARRGGHQGRPGNSAAGAAVLGRARRATTNTTPIWSPRNSAATRAIPAADFVAEPLPSDPVGLSEISCGRGSGATCRISRAYNFQTTMFQPVGGMDMIGKAFAKEIGDLIRYNAKVTQIRQNDSGVTVSYVDTANPSVALQARADWCVCTIPLSILSQIQIDVGRAMQAAIDAVPYAGSVKVGLQFKRRFWEEDEAIYGGITYTDLPIRQIAYPNSGFNRAGRGVLLGAYLFEGANSYEFTAMTPAERVKSAVEFGARHPSAIQGRVRERRRGRLAPRAVHAGLRRRMDRCDARAEHYRNLCQIDGRIVLAGEHASDLPAWQEGAILSSLDAIARLHDRVLRS